MWCYKPVKREGDLMKEVAHRPTPELHIYHKIQDVSFLHLQVKTSDIKEKTGNLGIWRLDSLDNYPALAEFRRWQQLWPYSQAKIATSKSSPIGQELMPAASLAGRRRPPAKPPRAPGLSTLNAARELSPPLGQSVLRSSWDQVFTAFWQRSLNPYSKYILTEDIVHREMTPDQKLLSRQLLTKTNRMPCWAERLFSASVTHSMYILEDSIVDPQNQTMTTLTWNINHTQLMVVEERCVYCVNSGNSGWTEIHREAWVSLSLFGVSRAVQEFGLARFKSNVTKTMKEFECILAKLQGETPSKTFVEIAKEAKEKEKETALAVTEKAKDLANKAATKKQQKQQFV
ncbi:PREDICTED: PRELI domain-containing protein 1, mitochondrial-like [Chrysochloris asiatica]|uniref:PRELI domain-containing protein 1, mitochondrial-like n=1 Tax=Chrysochloris asiatica TaxID=185453 RepID=A0A9B0UAI4_CHRAS|nr:PREDICTED: PRELI domain-containing protein 1, mitochondrial-like [Chrysochloris asiatica]